MAPTGRGQSDRYDDLLEKIRDIRTSVRRFCRKVLDIYATNVDYQALRCLESLASWASCVRLCGVWSVT